MTTCPRALLRVGHAMARVQRGESQLTNASVLMSLAAHDGTDAPGFAMVWPKSQTRRTRSILDAIEADVRTEIAAK